MLGIHAASGQFVRIAIFMSLHGPAGSCIPVASASPIHVFPIGRFHVTSQSRENHTSGHFGVQLQLARDGVMYSSRLF